MMDRILDLKNRGEYSNALKLIEYAKIDDSVLIAELTKLNAEKIERENDEKIERFKRKSLIVNTVHDAMAKVGDILAEFIKAGNLKINADCSISKKSQKALDEIFLKFPDVNFYCGSGRTLSVTLYAGRDSYRVEEYFSLTNHEMYRTKYDTNRSVDFYLNCERELVTAKQDEIRLKDEHYKAKRKAEDLAEILREVKF